MAAGEIQISMVETSRRDVSTILYIHKNDLFLIKRLEETAKYFLGYNPHTIQPKDIKFLNQNLFQVSRFTFQVLHTPGHTPGSCCFYFKDEKVIFTGDTLFKHGIGRYDFSYSRKEDLKKSLEKILKLPDDTIVYPGHGEKTIIGNEKEFALNLF